MRKQVRIQPDPAGGGDVEAWDWPDAPAFAPTFAPDRAEMDALRAQMTELREQMKAMRRELEAAARERR